MLFIKQEIEFANNASITNTRQEIDKRYAKKLEENEKSLNEQHDLLVKEIGGQVGSITRIHGDGPTARAIRERITKLETEIKNLNDERRSEEQSFEQALANNNYYYLRNRWGLVLIDASPLKRGEMIAKIESTPGFKRTEIAIRSLLAFLFTALLLLKLFQPHALRIYLSEALQDEWKRYQAGAFDGWLEPLDNSKANPSAMTPFRFEDLM